MKLSDYEFRQWIIHVGFNVLASLAVGVASQSVPWASATFCCFGALHQTIKAATIGLHPHWPADEKTTEESGEKEPKPLTKTRGRD